MTNSMLDHTNFHSTDYVLSDGTRNSNVSVIKEMMYLTGLEIKKGKDVISLSVGIPFYKMPEQIRKHVSKALNEKVNIDKYTFLTGMPELRQAIVKDIKNKLKIEATEEEILVTPGSMGALMYTMTAILNKGDEIILFSPYFSSHVEQIKLSEGVPVAIPLIPPKDKNDAYRIDLKAVKKKISKKTKAVLICNPANPTGAVLLKRDLVALAKIIKQNGIFLITDEVYDFLVYDNREYFNIASIKELWPKVIRCWSFSKKYGMTGWRLGYLHTNKELLKHILKIHDATIVCAPHIAQEAGLAALSENIDKSINANKKALEKNRNLICERLDKLPNLFSYIRPHGAYYILPKYHLKIGSIEFSKKLLYEAGVAVVPGIGFGSESDNAVRMSFGGTPDEINAAFDRIEKWWKNFQKI